MNTVVKQQTLKAALSDWTEVDMACYYLAISLGLMSPPDDGSFWGSTKAIFWSDNPVLNMLYDMLRMMVAQGILEKRFEPDYSYRWNPTYRGDWEE